MRVPALASAAIMLLCCAARADGYKPVSSTAPGPTGWNFQFTPYGWLPWVSGDAVVQGREFEVNENPAQVLDSLDFAWMSYMQARRGAVTLFSDIIYADVSNDGSFATSKTFSSHVAGTLGATLSADYSYWIVEAGGMYETNRWNFGNNYGGETDAWLEILAGGRYWHQELDINVALAGTLNVDGLVVSGATALARSGNVDWIDPFIGMRLHYKPTVGDEFALRGDIGGFGVGSQFTWHVLATYSSYLGTHSGIVYDGYLGYKALSVDYDEGVGTSRYEFDVLQQGPVMGITGKF
jgi:hypothetical protein